MIRYRVFVDVVANHLHDNNSIINNFYCDTLSEARKCAEEWKKTIPAAYVSISKEDSEMVAIL